MALSGHNTHNQVLLIDELIQGWDRASQLKAHMDSEVFDETKGMLLLDGIISSYENSLSILKNDGSMEQPQQQQVMSSINVPESPISGIASSKSEDINPVHKGNKEFSKKRKVVSISQIKKERVSSNNGLAGPPEDGYSWRKYGQKEILRAKYPRSYYRCTYRNNQGCSALKQVQQNDEDPSVLDITYKGWHTCKQGSHSKSAQTSVEKQNLTEQQNFPPVGYLPESNNMMLNFQTGLNIDTQSQENQENGLLFSTWQFGCKNNQLMPTINDNSFYSSIQQSFVRSPETSESNYFSTSSCKRSPFKSAHYGQVESDLTEVISATPSRTNSPLVATDCLLDESEFNAGFADDSEAFLSQIFLS